MLTLFLSLMIGSVAQADDATDCPPEVSVETAQLVRFAELKAAEAEAYGRCLAAVGMFDAAASYEAPMTRLSHQRTDLQTDVLFGQPVPDDTPDDDSPAESEWRATYVATNAALAEAADARGELDVAQRRQKRDAAQSAAAAGRDLVSIREELTTLRGIIPAESLPVSPALVQLTPRPDNKLPSRFYNCFGAQNAETPEPIASAVPASD